MIPITERLKKGEILICDGAMGTSLQSMGLESGHAPEEWNISHPEKVKEIHKSFIGAGCDMITTNTFGANPIKLKKASLLEKFSLINKSAVEIAKEAAKDSVYVLGELGPTGGFLKPAGDYSESEFYGAFFKQAKILAESGVDAFIIETMSALDELKTAVSACKSAGSLPVIVSMTFNATNKGYRTMAGVSIEQFVSEMLTLKCGVIGANCGCGSKEMVEIMGQMKKEIASPPAGARNDGFENEFLIAQPNAGMPKLVNGKTVFSETPDEFAKSIAELKKIGVNIIGGCCGTTPGHIHEIFNYLRVSGSRA